METQLQSVIQEIVKELYDITLEVVALQVPPKKDLGDYAFGCFELAKILKRSPLEIAEELASALRKKDHVISDVTIAGPYLNIRVQKGLFTEQFLTSVSSLGRQEPKHETIFVDYIGTNVGKPLHIGHMCTPNQGQAMINLYKYLGYHVVSDSHIGDWGIIFGKLITAFLLWGDESKLEKDAVNHLFELYVKVTEEAEKDTSLEDAFRENFKKLSGGEREFVDLWKKFTKSSIDVMQTQLDRLHIRSDFNIGESFYEGLGLPKIEEYPDLEFDMKSIVKELIQKGIATQNDDGSVGVIFPEDTKIPSCILQKRDGSHGYLASDLAAIKYRVTNWDLGMIVYYVDVRQKLHLRQCFWIADKAGWLDSENSEQGGVSNGIKSNVIPTEVGIDKNVNLSTSNEGQRGKIELIHASNGFISLKEGAMSTRKGRIIKLDVLLDEAESRAKEIILEKRSDFSPEQLAELSRIIGIGAIKYGYLKKSRETDVVFDWDEFMTFEGNSGPYIQYAYVRARKILQKAQYAGSRGILEGVSFSLDEEVDLAKEVLRFHDVLLETKEKHMPHILCAYAYSLTKSFNSFYTTVPVISEEQGAVKELRLHLVQAFTRVLFDVFEILGIEMPEEM